MPSSMEAAAGAGAGAIHRVAAVGDLAALDNNGAQAPRLPEGDNDVGLEDILKRGGSSKRRRPLKHKR